MEFHPKESIRAVQKDSQLLFPHYFPCTGNENPHMQRHERARCLFAATHRLQLDGDESSMTSDHLSQKYNHLCACVRASAQWLIYLWGGQFASVLKRYTHTLNNTNVFTLSPGCEAFTAHQSGFVKDGFGFKKFSAPCDLSGAVQWSQSNRLSRKSLFHHTLPASLMLKRLKLLTTDTGIFVILTLWAWHFIRRPL